MLGSVLVGGLLRQCAPSLTRTTVDTPSTLAVPVGWCCRRGALLANKQLGRYGVGVRGRCCGLIQDKRVERAVVSEQVILARDRDPS